METALWFEAAYAKKRWQTEMVLLIYYSYKNFTGACHTEVEAQRGILASQ